MKKLLKNSVKKTFSSFSIKAKSLLLFLVCVSQVAFGQSYSLDKLNLICDNSLSVQARTLIQPNLGIGNYEFHTTIGGISFETIACPDDNIKGQIVSVDYVSGQFIVKIDSQTFYPELADWQMIPIAKFANTNDKAVFTIIDPTGAQCRYHSAFLNTLLGLRLFQADILLPSPNFKHLLENLIPTKTQLKQDMQTQIAKMKQEGYSDNEIYEDFAQIYLFLKGESLPRNNYEDVYVNFLYDLQSATNILFDVFDDNDSKLNMWELPKYNGRYILADNERTYIPTNINKLKVLENDLSIKSAEIQSVMMKETQKNYQNLSFGEQQTNVQEYLMQIFNTMFFQSQYVLTDWGKEVKFSINQNKFQLTGKPWYLFSVINDENKTVQKLQKESEMYNEHWDLLRQYNPAVITAIENTMQWAAFFRYIKDKNPKNWNTFISNINKVAIDNIFTPTSFEYQNDY
jgi:hypothetical protein